MESVFEIILGMLLGVILMYWLFNYFRNRKSEELTEHQSTILMEKIRSVCKLITVEGDYAEIYRYENRRERFMKLVSSSKKALIVIKAKALIGFDLRKLRMHADTEKKCIILTNFPQPEVLTIEPDLEFYDIRNGLFNAFTPNDLTALNKEAKSHILDRIADSGLMESANKEALESVLLIEKIVETIGWSLDYTALELKNNPEINKIEDL